jgi:hypothetical protein
LRHIALTLVALVALCGPVAAIDHTDCKAIIAAAETSKSAMLEAGTLYFHGKRMGKSCITVDYIKAFDVIRRSGDTRVYQSLLMNLKQKADTGNPKAIKALKTIDPSY